MNKTSTAVGGTSGVGTGVLIVWLAGYFGFDMTAEIGAVVGAMTLAAGGAIGSYGLVGIARRIWRGAPPPAPPTP